ncbi:DUF2607 family protein [Vibrio galatheae]|uniref:DUF2607 family protein n=1 Tax=Vibrio galatheae TaxID=579748 RepID=UPI001EF606AC|nr:DUF2607 family protein [Vibrio galatheae]
MPQTRLTPYHQTALALFAIALVLWLNFAFIDHQYDLSFNHHSDHHCQLFASGAHGLTPALPVVRLPEPNDQFYALADYHYSEVVSFAYLPRSPPLS